jgi:VWFA-related protein
LLSFLQATKCALRRTLILMCTFVATTAIAAAAQQNQQAAAANAPAQQSSAQSSQSNQTTKPQSASTPKLTSESKLVYVNAVVRDKKGKVVSTLNKDDFMLDEDGKGQVITNFVRENDLPLTVGLLVDTSYSQRHVLDDERDASYTFLDQMLRADKDKAFLIHFDREVELLEDLTGDRAKLKSGLKLLQIADPRANDNGDDGDSGGDGREHHHAGTQLYDAVYLASNEIVKKVQGRKALFILSDGVDRGSKESLEDAIEAAQRANAAVYSFYFADQEDEQSQGGHHGGWRMGGPGMGGPGYGGGGGYGGPGGGGGGGQGGGGHRQYESRPDGKKILEKISQETGGRLFQISKKLTVSDAYAQVQEDLRNQYTLGYDPQGSDKGVDYHKIHVTTKQSDLTVQARDGYYSGQ